MKAIIKEAYKLQYNKKFKDEEIIKEIKKILEIIKYNPQELNDLDYSLQ